MENQHIIKYSNGEITVLWDRAKCGHVGNCVKNLPQVFKPAERPWVKMENATSQDIITAVKTCPTGALSILA